jgi:hypothetical protein
MWWCDEWLFSIGKGRVSPGVNKIWKRVLKIFTKKVSERGKLLVVVSVLFLIFFA